MPGNLSIYPFNLVSRSGKKARRGARGKVRESEPVVAGKLRRWMLGVSGKVERWGVGPERGIHGFGRIIRRQELLLGLRRDCQRFNIVAARACAVRREAVRSIGSVL